jgi:dGTPase
MKKGLVKALSSYASRAKNDQFLGKYRNDFMRDRDRILYSKPFRRLSRKTQIFLPASDDHVRTRLTHSLEVAQISITSAQALGLDLDLTEAIALGHDIGHTPFGHTGERVLNLIATNCDLLGNLASNLNVTDMGFKHNLQGLRVANDLTASHDGSGLNLTNFTLWGICNHTSIVWKKCGYRIPENNHYKCNYPQNMKNQTCKHGNNKDVLKNFFYNKYHNILKLKLDDDNGREAWNFEGYLVKIADEIAQRHHDIEDGLIAKVVQIDDIKYWIEELIAPYFNRDDKKIFQNFLKLINNNSIDITPTLSKLVVGCLNRSLIQNSIKNLKDFCKHFSSQSQS